MANPQQNESHLDPVPFPRTVSAIVIMGKSGAGKSRLLTEALANCPNAVVLDGLADPEVLGRARSFDVPLLAVDHAELYFGSDPTREPALCRWASGGGTLVLVFQEPPVPQGLLDLAGANLLLIELTGKGSAALTHAHRTGDFAIATVSTMLSTYAHLLSSAQDRASGKEPCACATCAAHQHLLRGEEAAS